MSRCLMIWVMRMQPTEALELQALAGNCSAVSSSIDGLAAGRPRFLKGIPASWAARLWREWRRYEEAVHRLERRRRNSLLLVM